MAEKRDFDKLRLAAHGDETRMHAILQMEMRWRHAAKLHDTLTCEGFEFPDSLSGEQATADDIAVIHTRFVGTSDSVLDMTCGLGIDAFHLARKASDVTACEIKPALAAAARRNAAALGLTNVEIVESDSVGWLESNDRFFDVIFIDPARRGTSGGRLYALADCQPDVTSILPLLRSRCGRLVVKASPMLDVSRTVADLGGDVDIVLAGTHSECKELLAVVPGSGRITAVTVGEADFGFTAAEECAACPRYAVPETAQCLYEPFPAVMKSGGVKLLAERFGLAKAAPDTHLYFGGECEGFPGNGYSVEAVLPFDKRGIKLAKEIADGCAEVAVRNFGMTAEELRRRLGVKKEAGPLRVYGLRDACGSRLLAVTRR